MKCIYNKLSYIPFAFTILLAGSCVKKPTDYRSFLHGEEITYPAAAAGIEAGPGKNRVLLKWPSSADPTITKYIIYWNNQADSAIVNANPSHSYDTVKAYINSLDEGVYSFTISSFDSKGNKSIPVNIENIKVYGEKYQGGLLNRVVSKVSYINNLLMLTWATPDTVNVNTEIKYTDLSGQVKTALLPADSNELVIADWKLPTKIFYRSSYKPENDAIDTFVVTYDDSLIVSNLPVDKSLWKQVLLPNDANVNAYGTSLANIWDGQPGGYPNIYHSDGASIPHTFTIDLGKVYNQLTKFEEWGRTDCACHNPDDFEVWGIADTTGAIPSLLPTAPGWKSESIAKGWTLLTEVKRKDNGIPGIQTDIINNPPPVRFIRVRVLHTIDNSTSSHMSEISFWYNP